MSEDYYQILGVAKNATDAEIQKAYRRLARKHHPDLAEDKQKAKEEFQKVQQAYDVLSDAEKRRRYDQLGPNFESYASGGRGPFGSGPFPGGGMEFDLEDLLGQGGGGGASIEELLRQFGMQGRGRPAGRAAGGRRTAQPPAESTEQITIPFQTAVLGGQHQLQLTRDGAASENITLKIPAGIESGQTLRLRGQGPADGHGHRGDLLVTVRVAPHPHFERTGANLRVVVPISIREAVLGAKIDVPTPHGTISITVPPNSSSGKRLRLKGMGVRPTGRSPGDLIAELQIVLPAQLTDQQTDQLREWAEAIDEQPRRQLIW
jgi:DnaJ-class molecular chaperone